MNTAATMEYFKTVAKKIVEAFPEVRGVYLDGSFTDWKNQPTCRAYMKVDVDEMSHELSSFLTDMEDEMANNGYLPCIDLAYDEIVSKDILLCKKGG